MENFEEQLRKDLHQFLLSMKEVDNRMPECPDVEEKWEEIAISDYANDMSQELYDAISGGRTDFLRDHKRFQEDITKAVEILEKML